MTTRFRNLAIAGAAAAMLAVSLPGGAQANNAGAFVGGLFAGAVISGALNAGRPPIYAPAPVYSYPAHVCHREWQTVCDAYSGCYRRRVTVC